MIVAKGSLTGNLVIKQSIQGKINKATEYIEPITQEKTIVPTKQIQEVLPDKNIDLLSKVIVNAIPNEYIIPQGEIEITENGITNVTQYASANINVSGTKVYPPDWSEIGYSETPQQIIDNFNYAKEIKDNWDDNVVSLRNQFYGDKSLIYMPLVRMSKATNMQNMFYECASLKFIPQLDTSSAINMRAMFRGCTSLTTMPLLNTSNVTDTNQMFADCRSLTSIPLLDTSKATNVGYMFQACIKLEDVPVFDFSSAVSGNSARSIFTGCHALTNDSLNNILEICINMTSITTNKSLNYVMGLTEAQATICQGLSNYQSFLDAGWTTGY